MYIGGDQLMHRHYLQCQGGGVLHRYGNSMFHCLDHSDEQ